ncbi:hypothetical protein RvY_04488 [Ramazzottius varieornatus]|uniref:Uncharacterized protein n=1 Tax=Ramazzottius varieornatus TaxID=947166 RepID=A0A1D1UVC6_RAMVA|nr:hypothetical protein RvY_04488 [Ramazzottius varieornatus]
MSRSKFLTSLFLFPGSVTPDGERRTGITLQEFWRRRGGSRYGATKCSYGRRRWLELACWEEQADADKRDAESIGAFRLTISRLLRMVCFTTYLRDQSIVYTLLKMRNKSHLLLKAIVSLLMTKF